MVRKLIIILLALLLVNSALAIPGDVNGNGKVNLQDILLIVLDFGKTTGFNPAVDIAPPTNEINIFDVMIVVKNWGAGENDTLAPNISAVVAVPSSTSAAITWTTDEQSDSQIEYGPTTSYGSSTTLNTALVTAHAQTITGLNPGVLYHYRVKSKDATGHLATSSDFTFTTLTSVLTITTPSMGSCIRGVPYTKTFTASGGTPPYTFTKTFGSFPGWATFVAPILSGIPVVGASSFRIRVTDSLSVTAEKNFTLNCVEPGAEDAHDYFYEQVSRPPCSASVNNDCIIQIAECVSTKPEDRGACSLLDAEQLEEVQRSGDKVQIFSTSAVSADGKVTITVADKLEFINFSTATNPTTIRTISNMNNDIDVGDTVFIKGHSVPEVNGFHTVLAVVSNREFNISCASCASSSGGTGGSVARYRRAYATPHMKVTISEHPVVALNGEKTIIERTGMSTFTVNCPTCTTACSEATGADCGFSVSNFYEYNPAGDTYPDKQDATKFTFLKDQGDAAGHDQPQFEIPTQNWQPGDTLVAVFDEWYGAEWTPKICGGSAVNRGGLKHYGFETGVMMSTFKTFFNDAARPPLFGSGKLFDCDDNVIALVGIGSGQGAGPPDVVTTFSKVNSKEIGLITNDATFDPPGPRAYYHGKLDSYPIKGTTWTRRIHKLQLDVAANDPILDPWRANCDPSPGSCATCETRTTQDPVCAAMLTKIPDPDSTSRWNVHSGWLVDETRGSQIILDHVPYNVAKNDDAKARPKYYYFETDTSQEPKALANDVDSVMYIRHFILIKNPRPEDIDDTGCPLNCPGDDGPLPNRNLHRKPVE